MNTQKMAVIEGETTTGDYSPGELIETTRTLKSFDNIETVSYAVACTVFQPATNSRLSQTKTFTDIDSAEKYVKNFVAVNPLSEVCIYKETQKLLSVYDDL